MSADKKKKNPLLDYFYDTSIYMKDRTFVLFTLCELAALFLFSLIGVIMGDDISFLLIGVVGIVLGLGLLYFFVKKGKTKVAKIIMSLTLVLVLCPIGFFSKGGIDNGTPLMLLLGVFYLLMILDGKFRIVMCLLDTVIVGGWIGRAHV